MGPDKSWKEGITCPSHQAATIITGLWVHCQLEWQLKPGSSCGRWLGSREAGGAGTAASPLAPSISPPTFLSISFHISLKVCFRAGSTFLLCMCVTANKSEYEASVSWVPQTPLIRETPGKTYCSTCIFYFFLVRCLKQSHTYRKASFVMLSANTASQQAISIFCFCGYSRHLGWLSSPQ